MEKNFTIEIVTPARKVMTKEVNSIVIPAANGYMGIMSRHIPLVNSLGVGVLKYKSDGKEEYTAISGGFMEVSNNKVSIMADAAENALEIDVERAKRAEERARERLNNREGIDVIRAEQSLRRAIVRLRAASLIV